MSANALADMLRSRIQAQADTGAERCSIPFFLAHQILSYLKEAASGPAHDGRLGEVHPDIGDPSGDRRGDWGLRAREVHLAFLSARAAGGTWFATTNGADGLARIDNGTDSMWPVVCEWHEAELIEELVNCLRRGEIVLRPALGPQSTEREG